MLIRRRSSFRFFFFNDTATTEIYTLSLHDALPISVDVMDLRVAPRVPEARAVPWTEALDGAVRGALERREQVILLLNRRGFATFLQCPDRKSTRLNSSHLVISYAVFCLKKNNNPSSRDAVRSAGVFSAAVAVDFARDLDSGDPVPSGYAVDRILPDPQPADDPLSSPTAS